MPCVTQKTSCHGMVLYLAHKVGVGTWKFIRAFVVLINIILNFKLYGNLSPFVLTWLSDTTERLKSTQCVACSVVSDSATPWTVACQAPLSMGFSRQEYWSALPFPSPGDLPDPGIEPPSPVLAGDSFLLSHLGNPLIYLYSHANIHMTS